MAEAMISLSNLPFDIQVRILKEMSEVDDEIPIEINGDVYLIAFAVMDLINGLHRELGRYRKDKDKSDTFDMENFGIQDNKKK